MTTATRKPHAAQAAVPCDRACTIKATRETGRAFVQWADGTYAVKLDLLGIWTDYHAYELVFAA